MNISFIPAPLLIRDAPPVASGATRGFFLMMEKCTKGKAGANMGHPEAPSRELQDYLRFAEVFYKLDSPDQSSAPNAADRGDGLGGREIIALERTLKNIPKE